MSEAPPQHRQLRLGRRAPTGAPAMQLARLLTGEVPAHPLAVDNLGPAGWQMLDNDRYGDCVAPETRVLTADLRWAPAGDLACGDVLLSFTEQPVQHLAEGAKSKGRYYTPAVVECVDRVVRPCYELEFHDGTVVRCSAGHRWLCGSLSNGARWVQTSDLKAGSRNASVIGKPLDVWGTDDSYEAGYLAAALDGEGNLDQQGTTQRVVFSQVANPMLEQVEQALKALDLDYRHGIDPRSIRYESRQDVHRLAVGKRADFLRLMGMVRPARLLPMLDIARLGRLDRTNVARLVRKTFIGDREVVRLDTSSRTYFAEGLTSHNCVAVTWANARRLMTRLAGAESYPGIDAVLALYRTQNPGFPADDGGMVIQDALDYLHTSGGPDGVAAVAFAKVDHTDAEQVAAAIAIFGYVWVGLYVRQGNMAQFAQRQPWEASPGTPLVGGHSVIVGGYDSDHVGGNQRLITWGTETSLTERFWAEQVEEAWVVVWPEHLGTAQFLAGIDAEALAEAYTAVTHDHLALPPPPLDPAAADAELVAATGEWLGKPHRGLNAEAAAAVRQWKAARGLG